jgi:glycosyltransferase involved in cell wall biosynthesis
MPPLSVCALVPYPPDTAPSQRFRIEQWLPHLRDHGIRVELFPFADARLGRLLHQHGHWVGKGLATAAAFARRLRHCLLASRYDVILVHRAVCLAGPALLECLLRLTGRPLLFDFDDAIFLLHTTAANRRWGWLKWPGKTATLCRLSTHVLAGNSYLADYARRHNPRVTVIPSSVDVARYQPVLREARGARVVVGWTGSSTSQTYLELFAPMLRELLRRHDVELRVHSDREPALPGVPFVWRPWSPQTEVEELSAFDVGIMPMPDDPWTCGKCAMKALLYMALGIPAVCSAVGTNCEVIRHGENGLLAWTDEDWLANLGALIADPALRQRLGTAGRRTVEDAFSAQVCAERFAAVVRQVVQDGHKQDP